MGMGMGNKGKSEGVGRRGNLMEKRAYLIIQNSPVLLHEDSPN